jgi:hypothetical protein
VQSLAGLPGLLARVPAEMLDDDPADEQTPRCDPVPVTLLPRLLHDVRRTQRRRTWTTAGLAAAAAVTVTLGPLALFGAFDGPGDDNTGRAAPPPVTSSATTAPAQQMSPVGDEVMTASLALTPVAWGTRLDLACTYDPEDDQALRRRWTYVMIVHTRDGSSQQVATWRALPGRTMRLSAATAAGVSDLTWVEVRTQDGRPILKLKV